MVISNCLLLGPVKLKSIGIRSPIWYVDRCPCVVTTKAACSSLAHAARDITMKTLERTRVPRASLRMCTYLRAAQAAGWNIIRYSVDRDAHLSRFLFRALNQ